MKSNVYFLPAKNCDNQDALTTAAFDIFKELIDRAQIKLIKDLPIKIHSGASGNVTFTKPQTYADIIDHLLDQGIKPYFIETNTAAGERATEESHLKLMKKHNFTQIPARVADGKNGYDHIEVPISGGKHFQKCKIASGLADQEQILVMSHFKGHIMSGFGGALKQLGIGFASGRAKSEIHAKAEIPEGETIDWAEARRVTEGSGQIWNENYVYTGKDFAERVAEYATAAVNNHQYLYLNFAVKMTANCDCDGEKMEPVYEDLGLFASLDPVAIDQACLDMLNQREGKTAFDDYGICKYAEQLGLGSTDYELIEVN